MSNPTLGETMAAAAAHETPQDRALRAHREAVTKELAALRERDRNGYKVPPGNRAGR